MTLPGLGAKIQRTGLQGFVLHYLFYGLLATVPTVDLVFAFLLLSVAVLILMLGGDMVVNSASSMAMRFGATEIAVAATVVAIGTSLPELFVSVVAAIESHPEIALGNVFGSNIANVGLVLGVTALIQPVRIQSKQTPRLLTFYLFLLCLLLLNLLFEDWIGWPHGVVMLGLLGLLILWLYKEAPEEEADTQTSQREIGTLFRKLLGLVLGPSRGNLVWQRVSPADHIWASAAYLFVGMVCLVLGGRGFVGSATVIAEYFELSEFVVALAVVAVGTSLPEVAVSIAAATRGRGDMSLGNIVGSNIFNLLLVIGVASLIVDFEIDLASSTTLVTFGVMCATALAMWIPVVLMRRRSLGRSYGALLLLLYIATMWFWFS